MRLGILPNGLGVCLALLTIALLVSSPVGAQSSELQALRETPMRGSAVAGEDLRLP